MTASPSRADQEIPSRSTIAGRRPRPACESAADPGLPTHICFRPQPTSFGGGGSGGGWLGRGACAAAAMAMHRECECTADRAARAIRAQCRRPAVRANAPALIAISMRRRLTPRRAVAPTTHSWHVTPRDMHRPSNRRIATRDNSRARAMPRAEALVRHDESSRSTLKARAPSRHRRSDRPSTPRRRRLRAARTRSKSAPARRSPSLRAPANRNLRKVKETRTRARRRRSAAARLSPT